MEFPFDCSLTLSADEEGFSIHDALSIKKLLPGKKVGAIIDTMGELSAKVHIMFEISQAQGLKSIITTTPKFIQSDNHIYIKTDGNSTVGFLKVGVRKLFIRDYVGTIIEISPLCVLDFYVHETVQRSGYGKVRELITCQKLFERMLEHEKVVPEKLAYDRPSSKLLAFLSRHYGLTSYIPQNNNFVVYNEYFTGHVRNISNEIEQNCE